MKTNYKSTRKRNTRKRNTRGAHPTKQKRNNMKKYNKRGKGKLLFIIAIILIIVGLYKISPDCIELNVMLTEEQEDKIRQIVQEELQKQNENTEEQSTEEDIQKQNTEEVGIVQTVNEIPVTSRSGSAVRSTPENTLTGYRITSYYPGDGCASTNKTGSGKTTADFEIKTIGNKSVYTYNGKIVVAAATNELLKTGYSVNGAQQKQDKHYFNYYDTIKIQIDGTYYDGIILDSCRCKYVAR